MNKRVQNFLLLGVMMFIAEYGFSIPPDTIHWKFVERTNHKIYYTETDLNFLGKLERYLEAGNILIENHFKNPFPTSFEVYVFPERNSLTAQWQKDWGQADFQPECWMVASGIAHRFDLLSPNVWAGQACEHKMEDSVELRKLIIHELVHVYHSQYNPDHYFNKAEGIDWLIEGLATYVSGQLTEYRYGSVKNLVLENKAPVSLDNFWRGKDRYGLSGSFVEFLDKKYGRKRIFGLMKFTNRKDVLNSLGNTESELIQEWRKFVTDK